MGVRITTNLGALNASRKYNAFTSRLERNFQRLATGSRINTARDDIAGFQVSTRMQRDLREYSQVLRNVNDGISLTQVASGALTETVQMMQEIRQLAVQSANAPNNDDDRLALQVEVEGLLDEIDYIAKTTEFGGIKLLNGGTSSLRVKTGSDVKDAIAMRLRSINSFELGHQVREETDLVDHTIPIDADSVFINEFRIRDTVGASDDVSTAGSNASAITKAAAINASSQYTGVTAQARESFVIGISPQGGELNAIDYVEINGAMITGINIQRNDATKEFVNAVNAVFDQTGVTAQLDDLLNMTLSASDGRNIEVTASTVDASLATGLNGGIPGTEVTAGTLILKSESQFELRLGGIEMDFALGIGDGPGSYIFTPSFEHSLGSVDITTADEALRTIEIVDTAIKQIGELRNDFGGVTQHLSSTVNTIESQQISIELARSRIADTDLAVEAASLSRHQILQDASASVLSQANLGSAVAMTLLEAGRVPLMNDNLFGTVPFRPGSMPNFAPNRASEIV